MNGPRIYNSESPQAREAKLRKKRLKYEKEQHRNRRKVIMIIFAAIFAILGYQLWSKADQTHRINNQLQASKNTLAQIKAKDERLTEKRNDLKDPDYAAKFIRNKFFYTKNNEKVYDLPDGDNN